MNITTILTAYNRPEYLDQQISLIQKQTVKSEIWIWYNKGEKSQKQIKDPNIKTIVCNHNFKFHGRFSLALLAKTKYVAIFDDDCFPHPKWYENCLDSITKCNGILGTTGVVTLSKKYHPNKKYGWNGIKSDKIERVDLVGHGWFFKKEWAKYMWMEEPLSWDNGEDIQFSYLCQKYGNINTYVPPHPENNRELWGNHPKMAVQAGDDENATHLHAPNHYLIRNNLCKTYMEKGWNTVNNHS